MPQKAHAASCIAGSFTKNVSNQHRGLWITDTLLAEAFHNFCHLPRRYGSNVPGPLEARRRASRRKNASLACANAAGAPLYDPAVILGSGLKDQWWKNTQSAASDVGRPFGQIEQRETGTFSLLPSWLLPTSAPGSPTLDDDVLTKGENDEEKKFQVLLERTTTLSSVRSVLLRMQPSPKSRVRLSELTFRRLIGIYAKSGDYGEFAEAFYDPIFHPSGSENHLYLIEYFCTSPVSQRLWETDVLPALLKAVESGLVSTRGIQTLIHFIPQARGKIKLTASSKAYGDWLKLLDTVEKSRVLQLTDLDTEFLSSWYQQIESASKVYDAHLLLWKLGHWSGRSEVDLAVKLTTEQLRYSAENGRETSAKVTGWLKDLPVDILGPTIYQVTSRLLTSARERKLLSKEKIKNWSDTLPHLSSESLQSFAASTSFWSQASALSYDLTPPQRLLTLIWLVTRVWSQRPDAALSFATSDLRDEFERTFTHMEGSDRFDHVSRVVLTLDTLPLPGKDQIFPFLQHFTEENLMRMLGNEQHVEQLKACFRIEYAQLRDSPFVSKAQRAFPEILQGLARTVNSDLPQFKAMAQTLILKSHHNFRVVRQLLRHNFELRFAASRSWTSAATTDKTDSSTSSTSSLDPAAVLDVLEMLTITFAVAPSASPRSTFRNVVFMYSFLHKIGAPLNPVVSRAIWYAGVTRFGDGSRSRGPPEFNVRWCLQKVREIEGKDTADRLLWSAGFRRDFVRDLAVTKTGTKTKNWEMNEKWDLN